jgi:hypothetical protein
MIEIEMDQIRFGATLDRHVSSGEMTAGIAAALKNIANR